MKVYIGSDHTGYELKEKLKVYLTELGYEVGDKGAFTVDPADDYPDFIRPTAQAVAENGDSLGIIMGGSGQGEAMCANKVKNIRCSIFYGSVQAIKAIDITGKTSDDPYVLVKLAREHNNANMLSLGVRFLTDDQAKEAVRIFLDTPFSNDPRHIKRINKLEI